MNRLASSTILLFVRLSFSFNDQRAVRHLVRWKDIDYSIKNDRDGLVARLKEGCHIPSLDLTYFLNHSICERAHITSRVVCTIFYSYNFNDSRLGLRGESARSWWKRQLLLYQKLSQMGFRWSFEVCLRARSFICRIRSLFSLFSFSIYSSPLLSIDCLLLLFSSLPLAYCYGSDCYGSRDGWQY